ncbi:MAG: hypothetical protein FWG65_12110 [Turicibacter sp.]|nr:hypothetical protein [Turicibacter sp.]
MKIAYCQLSALPAYNGKYGTYCKEPCIDTEGAILGSINDRTIENICKKIETQYNEIFMNKLDSILTALSNKDIELLVFPEYSVNASSLQRIHNFAISEKCICVAASHSVQADYDSIYSNINMIIDIEKSISMSCCPVILPDGKTIPVFKKYKSKWESNMEVESDEYELGEDVNYIIYGDKKMAISVCIDALRTSINPNKCNLVIAPAASPSTGEFKNKFASYLSQDIPSIFCNAFEFGGSTVYCHAPKEHNIPYTNANCIIETAKFEEVVVIADVEIADHTLKRKTVNTRELIKINEILPILHKDNLDQITLRDNIKNSANNNERENLRSLVDNFANTAKGIIAEQKNYLSRNINSNSIKLERIANEVNYIEINDFSLMQYQANWIEKSLRIINEKLIEEKINHQEVSHILSRLYSANRDLNSNIKNKIDLTVFEDSKKSLSTFVNRGSEIARFRKAIQAKQATIFILNGFSGIGKSAFVDKLKELYSFQTIDKSLPKKAGFEGLLRALEEAVDIQLQWNSLDNKEIYSIATKLSSAVISNAKTIIVIKNVGQAFDDYNRENSICLISAISKKLYQLGSKIAIIIETSQKLPEQLKQKDYIEICELKPLNNLYIGRLVEQVASQITHSMSMVQPSMNIIDKCKGNPNIAKLIGKYLADKINKSGDSSLSISEIESFTNKYVDEILERLEVVNKEKDLLTEMCIFRVAVNDLAYEQLPNFDKSVFEDLKNKMMIEETNGMYQVNSLIIQGLGTQIKDSNKLHEIAAKYYDEEYKHTSWRTAKAEYFYHASFSNSSPKTKELIYYSNDIFNAAQELSNNRNYIDIALSHLETIQPWKKGYWRFHLLLAYCYIIKDRYAEYDEQFRQSIECYKNKNQQYVPYFLMIRKLIHSRKLTEAEILLNEVQDKFGRDKQLDSLWIMYRYANQRTRERAVNDAVNIANNPPYDIHCVKNIVPILFREGHTKEALRAVDEILKVWSTNDWASSMKRKLLLSKDFDDTLYYYDYDDDDEFISEE